MTTPVASEVSATALPVTGSGPFTMVVALIGLMAVGVGWLMRRFAQA